MTHFCSILGRITDRAMSEHRNGLGSASDWARGRVENMSVRRIFFFDGVETKPYTPPDNRLALPPRSIRILQEGMEWPSPSPKRFLSSSPPYELGRSLVRGKLSRSCARQLRSMCPVSPGAGEAVVNAKAARRNRTALLVWWCPVPLHDVPSRCTFPLLPSSGKAGVSAGVYVAGCDL